GGAARRALRPPRARRGRAGGDRPLRGAHGAGAGERRARDAGPRHGRGRVMARAGFTAISSGKIKFGKDGRWYSDDEPIPNRAICRLFSREMKVLPHGLGLHEIGVVTVDDSTSTTPLP